jgi:hypothetical protein
MADGLRKGCMIHIAAALTATHSRAAAADTLRDVLLDDNKYVPAWVARGERLFLLLYYTGGFVDISRYTVCMSGDCKSVTC